jgi:hypothetical protein
LVDEGVGRKKKAMTAQGMALFIHILAGFGLLFAEWGPIGSVACVVGCTDRTL